MSAARTFEIGSTAPKRDCAGAADRRRKPDSVPLVRVLEEDPDLAAALSGPDRSVATEAGLAPAYLLRRGPWRFLPPPDPAALGVLLLGGLVIVRMDAGERAHVELLGAGDIISPWIGMGPDLAFPVEVTSRVVSDVRLALLSRAFSLRMLRWPEIHAAVVQRMVLRTRRLSLQAAINSLQRTHERVELTLWMLAFRFGRVTPRGHVVKLPISHSQLAELVAASRPSVTQSLTELRSAGRVLRPGAHVWVLPGEPPQRLRALARQTGLHNGRLTFGADSGP
jgi:CRP-like cAMP-binding protein